MHPEQSWHADYGPGLCVGRGGWPGTVPVWLAETGIADDRAMKEVSINDLKRNLSGYLEEAARGEPIVVTKHRRPWAKLSAADTAQVWAGSRVGEADLRPVLSTPLPARAWQLLDEDRDASVERPSSR
jgi:prevent-host-death family protein